MAKEDKVINKADIFGGISTPIAALSLFYTLIFLVLDSKIESNEVMKAAVVTLLLFITFFFTVSNYNNSKNKSESMLLAAVLLYVLWFIIFLFLSKELSKMYGGIGSSLFNIGLGWLILIPLFGITIYSMILCNRYYNSLTSKGKKVAYWLTAIIISSLVFLFVKFPDFLFTKIVRWIVLIEIPWIQILIGGLFMGVIEALIVAPIIPLINRILSGLTEWINRSYIKKNKTQFKKDKDE